MLLGSLPFQHSLRLGCSPPEGLGFGPLALVFGAPALTLRGCLLAYCALLCSLGGNQVLVGKPGIKVRLLTENGCRPRQDQGESQQTRQLPGPALQPLS